MKIPRTEQCKFELGQNDAETRSLPVECLKWYVHHNTHLHWPRMSLMPLIQRPQILIVARCVLRSRALPSSYRCLNQLGNLLLDRFVVEACRTMS